MGVERSVRIAVEVESIGQFDRTERWKGKLQVTRESDGRVHIGDRSTQSGFAGLIVSWDDLREAVHVLDGEDD